MKRVQQVVEIKNTGFCRGAQNRGYELGSDKLFRGDGAQKLTPRT